MTKSQKNSRSKESNEIKEMKKGLDHKGVKINLSWKFKNTGSEKKHE